MILLDLSQVCISNLMVQLRTNKNTELDVNFLRHLILNQIRFLNKKFKNEYGELVICCDSRQYWRKKAFSFYKSRRKTDREASGLDWDSIFQALHAIRAELKEYFPYRVVEVLEAEADDIIASLCHRFGNLDMNFGEQILIISGDKDFGQLQKYSNVSQYNPTSKLNIVVNDPEKFLLDHIIKGDTGDGIPNIFSDDDTLVTENKRSSPVTVKKMNDIIQRLKTDKLTELELRNYKRNEELIDLSKIPYDLQDKIIEEYDAQVGKGRNKLFNYFIKYKLKNLHESIGEF